MLVAGAVVEEQRLLQRALDVCHGHVHAAVLHVRGMNRELESVERDPRVAAAELNEAAARVVIELKGDSAEAALTIAPSSIDELREVVAAQRLQAHHARSREQRRVHLERWVLRRGPEKGDQAGLNVREHRVLL